MLYLLQLLGFYSDLCCGEYSGLLQWVFIRITKVAIIVAVAA